MPGLGPRLRGDERSEEGGADVLFDAALEIALDATEETVRADTLRIATLKWRTAMVAPRKYGPLRLAEPEEDGKPVEVVVRRFFPDEPERPKPPPRPYREPIGSEWC